MHTAPRRGTPDETLDRRILMTADVFLSSSLASALDFSRLPVSSHICGGPFGYTRMAQLAATSTDLLSTDVLSTEVLSTEVLSKDVLSNSESLNFLCLLNGCQLDLICCNFAEWLLVKI